MYPNGIKKLGSENRELSTLIYLIFPILAIFVDKRGNLFTYLIVCTIFIFSYVTMILFYKHLSDSILYSLLVIHYLGIFYFVYSVNPMNSLFSSIVHSPYLLFLMFVLYQRIYNLFNSYDKLLNTNLYI